MPRRAHTWTLAWLWCSAAACFDPDESATSSDTSASSSSSSSSSSSAASSSSEDGAPTSDTQSTGATDGSSSHSGTTESVDDSSSTGAACVAGRDMCSTPADCVVGTCVDCQCLFDYGPCDGRPCDCVPPSNSICFLGGCFCYVPCDPAEPSPCPLPATGEANPVCGHDPMEADLCGLACTGPDDTSCPDGMSCVPLPDGIVEWGEYVCVYPS